MWLTICSPSLKAFQLTLWEHWTHLNLKSSFFSNWRWKPAAVRILSILFDRRRSAQMLFILDMLNLQFRIISWSNVTLDDRFTVERILFRCLTSPWLMRCFLLHWSSSRCTRQSTSSTSVAHLTLRERRSASMKRNDYSKSFQFDGFVSLTTDRDSHLSQTRDADKQKKKTKKTKKERRVRSLPIDCRSSRIDSLFATSDGNAREEQTNLSLHGTLSFYGSDADRQRERRERERDGGEGEASDVCRRTRGEKGDVVCRLSSFLPSVGMFSYRFSKNEEKKEKHHDAQYFSRNCYEKKFVANTNIDISIGNNTDDHDDDDDDK